MTDQISEGEDGLAAASSLMAECERGDIDQHAAPYIQATIIEIVALREKAAAQKQRIAELESELRSYQRRAALRQ